MRQLQLEDGGARQVSPGQQTWTCISLFGKVWIWTSGKFASNGKTRDTIYGGSGRPYTQLKRDRPSRGGGGGRRFEIAKVIKIYLARSSREPPPLSPWMNFNKILRCMKMSFQIKWPPQSKHKTDDHISLPPSPARFPMASLKAYLWPMKRSFNEHRSRGHSINFRLWSLWRSSSHHSSASNRWWWQIKFINFSLVAKLIPHALSGSRNCRRECC